MHIDKIGGLINPLTPMIYIRLYLYGSILYVYVCVYIYIYVYIYIHTYTYVTHVMCRLHVYSSIPTTNATSNHGNTNTPTNVWVHLLRHGLGWLNRVCAYLK